ncbi:lipopolysaccharide biosynthesis protein [Erythrobacter sp. GH1-10]|uniref:lipopolysaccharide biosynthesis protein n=1 Tax=Erythrobacter sp. GH1-10 TaxID=3349334 RepID=UPI00387792E5
MSITASEGGVPAKRPGSVSNEASAARGEGGKKLLRQRFESLLHLLGGNVGVAIIMFGSISLAARALGPKDFGAFVLILAIGRVSERLLRFESWQPLVRFVAAEEITGDGSKIARLYAYGLLLDIGAAAAAALVAIAAGFLIGPLIGLESDQSGLVAIYAVAIACNIRGMSSAALRMAGKFKTLAYIQAISGLARLGIAFVLLVNGFGLLGFVVLWAAMQIFDAAIFNVMGWRSLKEQSVPSLFSVSWRGLPESFPGFLKFAFSTNLSSTLRTLTHEADTLLVGFFVGPAGAGLYFLARRIAKVAQQVGDLVQMIAYPDLARLWARADLRDFSRIVKWVQVLLGGFAVAAIVGIWLLGKPILGFAFGPEFVAAFPLLIAQLVAVMLILHAAPSRSALLAMDRPTFVLAVAALSTAIFFITAFVMIPHFGAIGANFAHIAFGLVTAGLLDATLWRDLKLAGKEAER